MRGRKDSIDALQRVGDAYELRLEPGATHEPIGECPVVVSATHAEPQAGCIESNEWQEHQIEPARFELLARVGLEDAEVIGLHATFHSDEAHAPSASPENSRDVDSAAVPARERFERCNIHLLRQRSVDGYALSRVQEERALNMQGDAPCGIGTHIRMNGTTGGAELRAQRAALMRLFGEERHPHMPVRTVALEPEQQSGTSCDR